MDKKKLFWKGMAVVALVTAIILVVVNVVFFRMTEPNMLEEVSKRILMSVGILIVVECLAYPLVGTWASRKADGLDKKK